MAPANGSTEVNHTKFEVLRNAVCTSFANAAIAMRDASHAAENFSNWFSQVNVQNFAVSFQGGPPGLAAYGGQPYTVQTPSANGKKRKADQEEEVTGKKKRGPREKKPKDKDAPKRAPSAYLLYQNDIRKEIKEQNPNISNTELLQAISKKWASLEPENRQPYVAKHDKMKGEYETAKEVYDNKNNAPGQDISPVEKPKNKSSKPEVKAPEEDDEDDEAATSALTGVSPSSQSSSDEEEEEGGEDEEDEEAPSPEPPKKKNKKEIKAPTPPPLVKSDKNKKKHKHADKK